MSSDRDRRKTTQKPTNERPGPKAASEQPEGERGGPKGPEPTRFGDWEKGGRCYDF